MKKSFSIFLFFILISVSFVFGGTGEFGIHFLELGNRYTGDCVYINYGDIDILIDAGSRQSSAVTIKAYIDNYIQDNKLEYVIATHAHEDHIAAFCDTKTATGILASYEIGTIIDFPKTNSTSTVYKNYLDARDRAVEKGAVHYDALQCYNNEDGAHRVYDLAGDLKLEILYNYYYDHYTKTENDYSVCVRIIHNNDQYLFSGDLEADGEDLLADYYEANGGGLGHCVLFKGGHHGSATSNGEKLMKAITPGYVCVCTCAGSSEYRASPSNIFPSQDFIDRVATYTDKVYITSYVPDFSKNQFMSFNGNITFLVSDNEIRIVCSNNDDKLKDSAWFHNNRQTPEAWADESTGNGTKDGSYE